MTSSIVDVLRKEADAALHADYFSDAEAIFMYAMDNRPRVDCGEWTIYCQGQIDALHAYHCEKTGISLRRLTIDIEDSRYVLREEWPDRKRA